MSFLTARFRRSQIASVNHGAAFSARLARGVDLRTAASTDHLHTSHEVPFPAPICSNYTPVAVLHRTLLLQCAGCPILSAVSSRKGWEPRIPTNGPGIGFSGYGEVGPLSAERPDVVHHEPQPAKPTASPIPKYSAFQATYFLFPPTFYAFRISSSRRPESLAKSANNLQLIKW